MSTEELTAVKRKRGVEARFTLFKTYLTNLKTQVEIPNLEINRNVYIELESSGNVQAQLAKFWELEEAALTHSPVWSDDDKECERLF
ncbi:hypothetical protein NQ314_018003 [Rhamnusium bicolor]|uniref:Uncharacterized protein n=1 Tax=Rhamnusium bicolor TaxID=1586634 RepID=A0AAV8WSB6_9CUCU|nr:hypothetical protein NQ314_018003 [Rhamnusium bicolor]